MVKIFERPYFEMAYARKLFEPFQRLHSSSDYSGTGIGLATVKRIIRCHGSHVEGVNTVTEDCAKNLIVITQEISGRWVPRKRLNHLLSGPLGSRMFSHVEMDSFTTNIPEHEEYIQYLKCRRRHREEVD
jgi:signal transduction histidine kinase